MLRALIGWHLMGQYPWTTQAFDAGLLHDLWARSQGTRVDSIIDALDVLVRKTRDAGSTAAWAGAPTPWSPFYAFGTMTEGG